MRARGSADAPLANDARKALSAYNRATARRDAAEADAADALAELHHAWKDTCARFNRDVPLDALLIDVLASIEICDGDVWQWRGGRNNKGLPTFRHTNRQELSVVRYLAITFGVIDEEEWGVLYPGPTGTDDVNPWHRTLRVSPVPLGNPNRYTIPQPASAPSDPASDVVARGPEPESHSPAAPAGGSQ